MNLKSFFAGLGDFIGSAAHKVVDFFHPTLDQIGKDLGPALAEIGASALDAAMTAATAPGTDKFEATYQAAKSAALHKATSLGIQEAGALALSIRATAVNAAVKATAPPATE